MNTLEKNTLAKHPCSPSKENLATCSTILSDITVLTYMHLRIKFFCRRDGVHGPADVVLAEVVCAVARVPGVCAAGPRQLRREGGHEVVKGPRHNGVVVGGHVKIDYTDGKANS